MTELRKLSKALKQLEEDNFKLRAELMQTKVDVRNSYAYKDLKKYNKQVCKKLNELEIRYRKLNVVNMCLEK